MLFAEGVGSIEIAQAVRMEPLRMDERLLREQPRQYGDGLCYAAHLVPGLAVRKTDGEGMGAGLGAGIRSKLHPKGAPLVFQEPHGVFQGQQRIREQARGIPQIVFVMIRIGGELGGYQAYLANGDSAAVLRRAVQAHHGAAASVFPGGASGVSHLEGKGFVLEHGSLLERAGIGLGVGKHLAQGGYQLEYGGFHHKFHSFPEPDRRDGVRALSIVLFGIRLKACGHNSLPGCCGRDCAGLPGCRAGARRLSLPLLYRKRRGKSRNSENSLRRCCKWTGWTAPGPRV